MTKWSSAKMKTRAPMPRSSVAELVFNGKAVDDAFSTRTFETRFRRLPADGCPTRRQPNPWVFCDIHHAEYPTNSPRDAARRVLELLLARGQGQVSDGDRFEVMVSDLTGLKVVVSTWNVDASHEWRFDARPAVKP